MSVIFYFLIVKNLWKSEVCGWTMARVKSITQKKNLKKRPFIEGEVKELRAMCICWWPEINKVSHRCSPLLLLQRVHALQTRYVVQFSWLFLYILFVFVFFSLRFFFIIISTVPSAVITIYASFRYLSFISWNSSIQLTCCVQWMFSYQHQ